MAGKALERDIAEESRLEAFAAEIAAHLVPPLVIYLQGPLGAGKTTFVRALLKAVGHTDRVKSPTYGLVERYDTAPCTVLHLDLYRVENAAELEFLALRDQLDENTVLLIEWPDHGAGEIPPPDLEIRFSNAVTDRSLTAEAFTDPGRRVLSPLLP